MPARVHIRPPRARDEGAYLGALSRSKSLHVPWVHKQATKEAFRHYLERCKRDDFAGYLLLSTDDDALVGVVNVSQIYMEGFRSAYLGYFAIAGFEGKGLMKEGLGLVLREAFDDLGLHRVEANIQPENLRSRGLVQSLGRPGGNITGLSHQSAETAGKRLELLKELVPGTAQIGVLWDKGGRLAWQAAQSTAGARGWKGHAQF